MSLRGVLAGWVLLSVCGAAFAQESPEPALAAEELAAVRAAENARIQAIESVYGAVVAIYGNDRGGGGSGVLYDSSGLAITNHHVVAAAGTEGWAGLADGKLYRWRIIGTDPGGDVAIIQLLGKESFPTAKIGNSDHVRVGDFAMAMGNPFVLAEDQRPTVTLGIVSGVERYQEGAGNNMLVYGNCIQIDSSINPGNSGGPLFNMRGEVIGINGRGSFKERGRVNVGLGYAISANQVQNFIPDLLATKMVQHGTLDALFGNRGSDVICHTVNLDTQIAKLGLKLGDKLLAFEGQKITSANQFTNLITTLPAGWPCEVTFERDGKPTTVHVRLTPLPYGPKSAPPPMPEPKKEGEPQKDKPKADEPKGEEPKGEEPKEQPTEKPGAEKPSPDQPEDKKPTDEKGDENKPADKKPANPMPQPVRLPMRQPPNFGQPGEVRDLNLNRENAKRVITAWQRFSRTAQATTGVQGWKLSDKLIRGADQEVGQQTLVIARDGRFHVQMTLDNKSSRFGFDGKTFWSQVGDEAPVETDAERLVRNPFAAQGYVLATLQTAEPLATIGPVQIDAGDKALRTFSYRLKAVDAQTDEFFVWLSVNDAAGQPEVRLLKSSESFDDERVAAVTYDQWQTSGGVLFPHKRQLVTGLGEAVALTIATAEVSPLPELSADLFQKPNHEATK